MSECVSPVECHERGASDGHIHVEQCDSVCCVVDWPCTESLLSAFRVSFNGVQARTWEGRERPRCAPGPLQYTLGDGTPSTLQMVCPERDAVPSSTESCITDEESVTRRQGRAVGSRTRQCRAHREIEFFDAGHVDVVAARARVRTSDSACTPLRMSRRTGFLQHVYTRYDGDLAERKWLTSSQSR